MTPPTKRLRMTLAANAVIVAAAATVIITGAGTANAAKSCDLGFVPTKPTVGVGSIIGNAWAACDVPPERHELTLTLEIRSGGAWSAADSTRSAAIPDPRQVYEVKTECHPGLWRVTAHVVGSLRGRAFDFSDSSMERFVTAADCARGSN